MDADSDREALLKAVDSAVQDVCGWFAGPGLASRAQVDGWGPWEVLAHLLCWHQLTIDAVESAARGGPPVQLQASVDETNARALAKQAGKAIPDMLVEFRALHEEYLARVGAFHEADAILRLRTDGREFTLREQLQMNGLHVRDHVAKLMEAEAARPPAH